MDIIKGKCVSLTSEGKGVVKTDSNVIFVDSLLIGEEAEIEITYKKKDYCLGKIKKLYNLSKDRIIPKCKISTACGGCCFQNASYKYELEYKQNKVIEDLKRIGHIDSPVLPIIGAAEIEYYRNKIQVPFANKGDGVIYGFYRNNTHQIIPFEQCYIENNESKAILDYIAYLMKLLKIKAYDEDARSGVIRHVLIRTSSLGQIMVVLITNIDEFSGRKELVKQLTKRFKNIVTIVQNINSRDTNVVLGIKERILFGKGYINELLLGKTFEISAHSFFQVNHAQTEKLYSLALDMASLSKEDVVLDAYAGTATIGIIAASYCKEVISVEREHSAVINARKNAKHNAITNITIIEDDCAHYIKNNKPQIDVLIMDPPRSGSSDVFINTILNYCQPKTIIYISCNPATLARDLSLFSKAYQIDKIQPIDLFPRTFHVETICLLTRK